MKRSITLDCNLFKKTKTKISIKKQKITQFKTTLPTELSILIISYCSIDKIIMFQNEYPRVLNHVIIDDITKINKMNYIYIKKLRANNSFNNVTLKYLPNLQTLEC